MDRARFVRRQEFLPFSRPTIRRAEIDEVTETLASGWITTGPRAERFERAFAAYVGAGEAVAVSSATAGLHLALLAAGVGPGAEVITTSLTWAATVNMIEIVGATPVFVDIHRDTLQIDEEQVEAAVSDRTAGILPVHFAGAPCHMDPLLATAARHGLFVLEDAAHGIGTRYKGRHVGTFGRMGVFSFHPIKNITTGEGGCVTTDDPALAARLRSLRFHGLAKSAWNRYAEGGTPQVEIVEPGLKYNFMDLQAALGLHQLPSVDEFNARRTVLARRYHERLAGLDEIERPSVPSYPHTHSWNLYPIRIRDGAGIDRDGLLAGLRERNVGTGIHFRAVHTQPFYARKYPQVPGTLPRTEWVSERVLSLPLFPLMHEEDVDYVVAAIGDTLARRRP